MIMCNDGPVATYLTPYSKYFYSNKWTIESYNLKVSSHREYYAA